MSIASQAAEGLGQFSGNKSCAEHKPNDSNVESGPRVPWFDVCLRRCTIGQIQRQLTKIQSLRTSKLRYSTLLTYLLTPWCRVLLEKLTGLQLVKKFPAFYGTQRFITALTSVHHPSLSWDSPIQSTYPHPTSWRSILILSTHLCLGLPNGLLTYLLTYLLHGAEPFLRS